MLRFSEFLAEGKGPEQDKYHKGTEKKKKKRVKQFKKQAKMDDDDPEAYKDAPGDKEAREKGVPKSKHTKKYDKMFGESTIMLESFGQYLIENKAVRKKAKETGISYSILKQVYDRGVAAWKTGHRPGTTPQQWGLARINSFATGGKTRTTADKDLWKKHSASKKKKKKVNEEKTSELIKKSQENRGRKGTLKAKIKGKITKEKVLALKNDEDATTLDKKQANFWLNMNEDVIMEAEYQGKKVKLNDPIRNSGGKKKFKVYTTHPKTGNVIKVQFGDPGLSIKRDNDDRRKAFRARHGCDAVTFESDRHTPKYWSCKMWTKSKKVSDLD